MATVSSKARPLGGLCHFWKARWVRAWRSDNLIEGEIMKETGTVKPEGDKGAKVGVASMPPSGCGYGRFMEMIDLLLKDDAEKAAAVREAEQVIARVMARVS